MRFIAVFLMFFLTLDANAYMTREEILKELEALKANKSLHEEMLNKSAVERQKHLTNKDEFLKGTQGLIKKSMNLPKQNLPLTTFVDLRYRDTKIKSQDDSKCTAFSGVAGIENLMNRDKIIPGLDLSEWFAFDLYNQYSSDAFVNALTKYRIGDEIDWPQYGKLAKNPHPYVMLSKVEYIESDFNAMVNELMKKNVIYLAMETPTSLLNCDRVVNPKTKPAGGGHALLVVGFYLDGNGSPIAIIRNSWGADCGDSGYQYMLMDMCSHPGYYCYMWAFQEVDILKDIPSPAPTPVYKKECTRSWRNWWRLVCTDVLVK
jgi:C1A family cysteine protease